MKTFSTFCITVRCHAWCGKPVSLFDGVVRGRALLLQLQLNWLHYASWVVGWTALRWVCQGRPGSWVRHCPEDWSEVPGIWFTGKYSRTCKDFLSWEEAFTLLRKVPFATREKPSDSRKKPSNSSEAGCAILIAFTYHQKSESYTNSTPCLEQ